VAGPPWRAVAAEGVGVFFIVLAGGAAILSGGSAVAVSLAFAFAVAVLVYAFGHVCGAHFNPAVTVAFAVTGHFPWRLVPLYSGAQVAGATAASGVLLAVYGDVGPAVADIDAGLDPWKAVLVESLATAMLALVIIAVATDRRAAQGLGGLAIGLAVGVGSLWAGPLTGGSMNPARAFGPALVALEWPGLWVHLTAPFAGAVAGMIAYQAMRAGETPRNGGRLGALGQSNRR